MADQQSENSPKAPRERSPSFPIIPLKVALDRLVAFEDMFGRHPAPYQKVALAWGIKEGSSQANQILAALKSFGLVEYSGSGKDRVVSITEMGRTYLRAQQDSIKSEIIKKAALQPKAIARFWPSWRADRPIDAICLDSLVLEHGFNEKAAPSFLRVYDETITYAGLGDSDKIQNEVVDDLPDGLDYEDVPLKDAPPPPPAGTGVVLMQGERELTSGLLSKSSEFRLIVKGSVGAREIERLIAKLELDKEILAEPDANEKPLKDD